MWYGTCGPSWNCAIISLHIFSLIIDLFLCKSSRNKLILSLMFHISWALLCVYCLLIFLYLSCVISSTAFSGLLILFSATFTLLFIFKPQWPHLSFVGLFLVLLTSFCSNFWALCMCVCVLSFTIPFLKLIQSIVLSPVKK